MENIRRKDETQVPVPPEACVQADRDRSLSRQELVSDNSDTSLCRPAPQEWKYCAECRRELPLGAFYRQGKQHEPDSYCKECRKAINRLGRKLRTYAPEAEERPPRYPVITDIRQREIRIQLILNALCTVRQSIMRKNRKRREEEFLKDKKL